MSFIHTNKVHDIENGESRSVKCDTVVQETVSSNSMDPINREASIVTRTMKRAKPTTSIGSNEKTLKSSKRLKTGITSNDTNVKKSKEVNNKRVGKAVTGGQIKNKTKNLSDVKKKPGKQGKNLESKSPIVTSATKKGKIKINRARKGTKGDSTKIATPDIVEAERDTKIFPIPIVIGLQCKAMTMLQSKTPKKLPDENTQKVAEPQATESRAPLVAKMTGNLEGKEEIDADADTNPKRKRGRPFKRQSKRTKTSLDVENHKNGDAISEVNVEKGPNESCEAALTLQQEKYEKPVTGKRGKRRSISSITVEPSTQDCHDASKPKENGRTEISVEKSLDTMPEDQPLSKWFQGKKHFENPKSPPVVTNGESQKLTFENPKSPPIVTNGESQKLTFEKRSSLWSTIESMEAFRLIPQAPHFHPLNALKETARERQAISLMVNFSGLFEDTSRLRIDTPKTEIQDQFEKLSEFESHGFNILSIKNCLIELLSKKDKHEKLGTEVREFKGKIEKDNVEGQEFDNELELIKKQVSELSGKSELLLKKKKQNDLELAALEAELERIQEAKRKICKEFEDLAAALL